MNISSKILREEEHFGCLGADYVIIFKLVLEIGLRYEVMDWTDLKNAIYLYSPSSII